MTEQQLLKMTASGLLPNHEILQGIKETHISWILLGQNHVLKIKKPLKLSFLDFSTLEKRKYYCEQEVALNQRLTHDIYLDVCPLRYHQGQFSINPEFGEVVEYAVLMRRLDNSREMSKLLTQGKVSAIDVEKIANQLVPFHQNAEVIKGVLTPELIKEDFNDIRQIFSWLDQQVALPSAKLEEVITFSDDFIDTNAKLILARDSEGLTRDCHGDLHSGNIFLLAEPVIFDCIEFNLHLRTIDILGELGFFCMDLDSYQRRDLSNRFIEIYNHRFPVIRNQQEHELFIFYKMYRANVKAKINAIKAQQAHNDQELRSRVRLTERYFQLVLEYHSMLQEAFEN